LVCADQIPSEISQFFFSNIGTLIFFRHSDGYDLQRLRYSSGATAEQILENYSLKPGDALVRSMRFKDLHKVTVPFEPVEKFISREEVDRTMAPRLAELNQDVIPANAATRQSQNTSEEPLDSEERRFLECLAKDFDRPSSEVYRELGLGESKGFRIKQRLLAKRYLSEIATNLGKDGKRAVFLVPNRITFEHLGIELGPGRGGALHKHFQTQLKQEAERLGFIATIEPNTNSTSEGPDLGLEKNGNRIAVEISITSKPAQEAKNIGKNLRLGFTHVVLSFVHREAMDKARELASQRYADDVLKKASFCLVTQVPSALEGF